MSNDENLALRKRTCHFGSCVALWGPIAYSVRTSSSENRFGCKAVRLKGLCSVFLERGNHTFSFTVNELPRNPHGLDNGLCRFSSSREAVSSSPSFALPGRSFFAAVSAIDESAQIPLAKSVKRGTCEDYTEEGEGRRGSTRGK